MANYLSNNFKRFDNSVLASVGERVWLSYPSRFVRLCVQLTQGAEEAAVSGVSDFQQLWGVMRQEDDSRLD